MISYLFKISNLTPQKYFSHFKYAAWVMLPSFLYSLYTYKYIIIPIMIIVHWVLFPFLAEPHNRCIDKFFKDGRRNLFKYGFASSYIFFYMFGLPLLIIYIIIQIFRQLYYLYKG